MCLATMAYVYALRVLVLVVNSNLSQFYEVAHSYSSRHSYGLLMNFTMFPPRYSRKAFFSASILSALASRNKESAVAGSPREGVANREEEEGGGAILRETRPPDWCATDTTPWFKVKNNRPPLYTPAANTQLHTSINSSHEGVMFNNQRSHMTRSSLPFALHYYSSLRRVLEESITVGY